MELRNLRLVHDNLGKELFFEDSNSPKITDMISRKAEIRTKMLKLIKELIKEKNLPNISEAMEKAYEIDLLSLQPLDKKFLMYLEENNRKKAADILRKYNQPRNLFEVQLKKIEQYTDDIVAITQMESDSRNSNTIIKIIASLFVGTSINLLIVIFVSSTTTSKVGEKFKKLIREVKQLKSISRKIDDLSETNLSTTQNLDAAVENSRSAMDYMRNLLTESAEGAVQAQKMATSIKTLTETGGTAMDSLAQSIAHLMDSSEELSSINGTIGEISAKSQIIHDIVFKTQLLSFNASIEATRAGEQGSGFKVVAEEVGNLAKVTGKAALEIDQLIAEGGQKIESLTSILLSKIEESSTSLDASQRSFTEITTAVQGTLWHIENLFETSENQETGLGNVDLALSKILNINQSNINSAEITHKSAKNMRDQSQKMNHMTLGLSNSIFGNLNTTDDDDNQVA